jgi:hypothetical protein
MIGRCRYRYEARQSQLPGDRRHRLKNGSTLAGFAFS